MEDEQQGIRGISMEKSLKKFKEDLNKLIDDGLLMLLDLYKKVPSEMRPKGVKGTTKEKTLTFGSYYQKWYTESRAVIKQIIPDHLVDFEHYYKNEKRKEITLDNYTIRDYLIGLVITKYREKVFEPEVVAFEKFQQQLLILQSAQSRFDSSLFDIQQVVRADIFDSELDGARELIKNGFLRAAGAIAGVVLEKHLEQVCINHNISITKRNPKISDYNDKLKEEEVLDVPTWRFIQRLGDLRNLCCHHTKREPKEEEVEELVEGVDKITKTLF